MNKRFLVLSIVMAMLTPSVAIAQTILFTDSFARTAGLGGEWTVAYGSFTTDGTYAVSGTPPINGNWAKVAAALPTNDYSVSANIAVPVDSDVSGLVVRSAVSDAFDSDLYAAQLDTAGALNLYRRNSWNWTLLASYVTPIIPGTSYSLKLVATGANPVHLEAWLNGTKDISYDDSSSGRLETGSVGLENYDPGVEYTAFEVDSVAADIFSDNFARTTGLGSNWQVAYGTFTTDGSHAISGAPPTNGNWASVVPTLGTSDYAVSADIVVPDGSSYSGLVARSSVSGEFDSDLYSAQLDTDGAVNVYRRNAWNSTLLSTVPETITPGTSYNLKLLVHGTNPVHLAVWFNGNQVISYDDSSSSQIQSGIAGIENYDSGVTYANFGIDELVNVTVPMTGDGSGTIVSSPAGISCPGTCSMFVPNGTAVTLAAQSDSTSIFAGWSGDCTGKSCLLIPTADTTATADMQTRQVQIAIRLSEDDHDVECAPTACPYLDDLFTVSVDKGTSETLTAHPDLSQETFLGWTGACYTAGTGVCTISPNNDVTTSPIFFPTGYPSNPPPTSTTITAVTAGQGSIQWSTGGSCPGTCTDTVAIDSSLTATAVPAAGYRFAGWGGKVYPINSTQATVDTVISTATLYSNWGQTITATFVPASTSYACGVSPCGHDQFPPASWRPYDSTSPFNRMLPSGTLDTTPNGEAGGPTMTALFNEANPNDVYSQQPTNWIASAKGDDGWPTYYGQSSDPTYSIICDNYGGGCSVANLPGHAPPGAQSEYDGTVDLDDHLTFIDQTSGLEYDLWQVQNVADTDVALTSVPPYHIHTSWSGYTNAMSGDGHAIGVGEGTAARVGNLAGRIRIEELQDAINNQSYINHALAISIPCTNGHTAYPADPDDTALACSPAQPNAPPDGARLHLNMTFSEINALPIPEWKQVLLRTLSKYGAIVMDTNGQLFDGSNNVTSFWFAWQTESGNQYTFRHDGTLDPWLTFASQQAGIPGSDWNGPDSSGDYAGNWNNVDDGIDWKTQVWDNLEVVDPCYSDGTCNP